MHLRVARHTNQLDKLKAFYTSILKLQVLGDFKNHEGYDGVFLGWSHVNWHLEFTSTHETVNHTFDDDDLLVFYPETQEAYFEICQLVKKHQLPLLKPKNPYWEENGILFKDPDGYLIVVSPLKAKAK